MYVFAIRPWHLRWGATDEEIERAMPGDNQIKHPGLVATRAITINAPAENIWPWLVQIGYKRAGWYSYSWIDHLGMPSADRIIPEFQQIEVGDIIPAFSEFGITLGFRVKAIDPNRSLLLITFDEHQATWAFGLYPLDEQHTRLVFRIRCRSNWKSPLFLFDLVFDPGDFIMMRKMLLGIKARVENRRHS